jgi:hypothetical protein
MDIHKKYAVTMVTWNSDDSLVATAQTNFLIKIWNSSDAELVHELKVIILLHIKLKFGANY